MKLSALLVFFLSSLILFADNSTNITNVTTYAPVPPHSPESCYMVNGIEAMKKPVLGCGITLLALAQIILPIVAEIAIAAILAKSSTPIAASLPSVPNQPTITAGENSMPSSIAAAVQVVEAGNTVFLTPFQGAVYHVAELCRHPWLRSKYEAPYMTVRNMARRAFGVAASAVAALPSVVVPAPGSDTVDIPVDPATATTTTSTTSSSSVGSTVVDLLPAITTVLGAMAYIISPFISGYCSYQSQ